MRNFISYDKLPDYYKKQINHTSNIPLPSSNLESGIGYELLAKKKSARFDGPVNLRIHCKRKRLTDSDGICAKYIIDALVTAKILKDDSPEFIKEVSHSQEKSNYNETIIEFYREE